jgi:hypothetical protein
MSGKIYIPKPCHENWNKMPEAEKGRHCAVCDKVVTDFTGMKTEEIISTLQESTQEVCGHINIKQLTPNNNRQKFYFWIKGTLVPKVAYAAFAIFGMAAIFKKSAYAQSVPGGMQLEGGARYQPQAVQSKKVNIEVVNESNKPLDQATVQIIVSDQVIATNSTDPEGRTTTTIETQEIGYTFISLEISAPGFETKKINNLRITKNNQTIKVKMDVYMVFMGQMVTPIVIEIDTTEKERLEPVIIHQDGTILLHPEQVFPIIDTNSAHLNDLIQPNSFGELNDNSNLTTADVRTTHFISFPNPTNGNVTIETNLEEPFQIKVFSSTGALILQETNQYKRALISLQGHAAGTYLVLLFIEGKAIETHKIILVK